MSVPTVVRSAAIADYDSNDYDYRSYWTGREYEQRAESAALRRVLASASPCEWLVDLGGGYGRNARHYRDLTRRAVLVDYSTNNLERAAELHGWDVLAGRLHLVRADVHALPFRDGAFSGALVVRLLHHLSDLDAALPEMVRTVTGWVVLDVPIKHHVLARVRALADGSGDELRGPRPRVHGDTDYPFSAFQLRAVRRQLRVLGWRSTVAASVNNFRRWDHVVPARGVRTLGPLVASLESAAQRLGRGWWGPNQFLRATRVHPPARCAVPPPRHLGSQLAELAARMWCPACHGDLHWSPDSASCTCCERRYVRRGAYWDFAR